MKKPRKDKKANRRPHRGAKRCKLSKTEGRKLAAIMGGLHW